MTGSSFENFIVTIARALYIKIQYNRSGNTKWVNLRNIIFTEFGVGDHPYGLAYVNQKQATIMAT